MSAFGWHAVCVRAFGFVCVRVILEMPTVGEFLEEEEVSGDLKARDEHKCYFCVSRQKDFFVCVFILVATKVGQSVELRHLRLPILSYISFKILFFKTTID